MVVVAELGVVVGLTRVVDFTVTSNDADHCPSDDVAVMLATPALRPTIAPVESTVAMVVLLEVQRSVGETSSSVE